jgi:hypothetical protein
MISKFIQGISSNSRRKKKKRMTTSASVDWVVKFVFLVLVPYTEFCLSSDDFYLDSSLVQGLIRVEVYFSVLS